MKKENKETKSEVLEIETLNAVAGGKLNKKQIAGIVTGAVFGAIVLASAIKAGYNKYRNNRIIQEHDEEIRHNVTKRNVEEDDD